MEGPICPLCKIRECGRADEPGWDGTPGEPSYFSTCSTCTALSGYGVHSHTYYGSPAQVAAGTVKAGHSWRTSVSLRPTWDGGIHTGYRCTEFDRCGWEQVFTAEELKVCPAHTKFPDWPVSYGQCFNHQEHRLERGECEPVHGYITDHGRAEESKRSDANNWDPGRYMPRV